jgi:chorismate mutase
MAEAELLAEVDRLRAQVDRLQAELLASVSKRWLTREQEVEATLRQHLAGGRP